METFKHNHKTYTVNDKDYPKVNIPKLGIRTAAEILIDEDAQEYLVEQGCVGTVILEVLAPEAETEEKA